MFSIIALVVCIVFVILYLLGLLGVFSIILATPFFIAMVLFLIISRKSSPGRKRQVFIRTFLFCVVIEVLLLLVSISPTGFKLLGFITNKHGNNNKNHFAQCAWLGGVPKNWYCKDTWVDDERHLVAYNPNDKEQQIELQIQGRKRQLGFACINLIPVGIITDVSPSGFTIPYRCFDGSQLLFRSDWGQDGYNFRLIGRKVSRELYINNLERVYSNWTSDDVAITVNPLLEVKPTKISLKFGQLELLGANLCREGGDGTLELNESPKIVLMPGAIPIDYELKGGNSCTLILRLNPVNSKVGNYKIVYEVNGLRQWLKDSIGIY